MSQQGDDAVSLAQEPQDNNGELRLSTADEDMAVEEHDSFEDAVDAVSVRSLTKRAVSVTVSKSQVPGETDSTETHTIEADPPSPAESQAKRQSRRPSSPPSSRISDASNLDNVNLDDEAADKTQEPQSPADKDHQPGKKLSLNSITGALPSMPWSPPAESPSKSSAPSMAAIASPPPPAAHPPPPTRKLTSPFSWLSRNTSSTKDRDSHNPEMMLSRLEEENEDGANGSNRESLKDRFKALRMQEEVSTLPLGGDSDKASDALGLVNQSEEVPVPLPSPVPGRNDDLAPGTVSGIKAGPSAMPDTRVDWDLWQSVVYEGPAAVARTSAEELNKAIAIGIPNAIRGVIWQVLARSNNEGLESVYQELVARGTDKHKDRHSNSTTASTISNGSLSTQSGDAVVSSASSVHSEQSGTNGSSSPKVDKSAEVGAKEQATAAAERKKKDKEAAAALQKLEKTIRRDLGARTSYSKYAAAAGLQEGLFGVCKAYALYDDAVGYAQGMNFLIMPLLFNMPEQEAFCLLVRLMNHYHLRDLFVQDMPGLHMHLYQFERLLEDIEPALYCHLHRRGISPHLYATQWFLTLFAYRFPLQLVLRIYDLILSEGLSAVLRFGLVLMQKNAATLLGISDMQQLTTHLKDKLFDVYIDKDPSQGSLLENGFFGSSSSSQDKEVYRADQFVRDACEVKMTPETLKIYTAEWEEKTRAERDREMELQELRAANQGYAVKVRKLEERVEVCDREQAALATELVHTKVSNEELRDENESLKGQVRELKVVIEKQPAEIEESWKLERDDLMKRNENVHVENQKLEKEMAELEEELVQTKMQYAEINSQHETLTRKWSDLRRQFA
ncbi:rab-GTPase-TBC domain-containing protein [Hirsutella rhossiliensis]|uniref:GTPase-activating protein GYP5 n=1 Tax=Hirsutella rhossiliensis TaxID=111463 RepID=A0A9P8SKY4_9HYPO|nr:rab-GTPase-TBC domain-containing protein [Hirsutella rhossiliensis]KAH0966903.1 rab-GTPase-TBC domain-containing protein [Hirsutella rhossiliensis]